MHEDGTFAWILAGISAVIAALSTTVATLFKLNESKNSIAIAKLEERVEKQGLRLIASDAKHDECQKDREELRVKVAALEAVNRQSHESP